MTNKELSDFYNKEVTGQSIPPVPKNPQTLVNAALQSAGITLVSAEDYGKKHCFAYGGDKPNGCKVLSTKYPSCTKEVCPFYKTREEVLARRQLAHDRLVALGLGDLIEFYSIPARRA